MDGCTQPKKLIVAWFFPRLRQGLTPSPKKDTKRGVSLGSGGTLKSSTGGSDTVELSGSSLLLCEGDLEINPDSTSEAGIIGVKVGLVERAGVGELDPLESPTTSLNGPGWENFHRTLGRSSPGHYPYWVSAQGGSCN